jgi:hypothetical protein
MMILKKSSFVIGAATLLFIFVASPIFGQETGPTAEQSARLKEAIETGGTIRYKTEARESGSSRLTSYIRETIGDYSHSLSNITVDKCAVVFTEKRTRNLNTTEHWDEYDGKKVEKERESHREESNYRMDLATLDPVSVKVVRHEVDTQNRVGKEQMSSDVWAVILLTYNSERIIQRKSVGGEVGKEPEVSDYPVNEVKMLFTDRTLANKVAQLFKQLIKSCGGKVEPF